METGLQLKPSINNNDDGLWVYLIFFEHLQWKLEVKCLWMSTEHLKDLSSGRTALETDLNLLRVFKFLLQQFSLLLLV